MNTLSLPQRSEAPASWGAVFAISLNVAVLTAAELLPVSLLTPIAADLHISEAAAGQTVTATAVTALLASLFTAFATRRLDRRTVLIGLSLLQVVSCLLAAFASGMPLLLAARLLLGVAVGGFWSLSASLAMRLVPEAGIPRALAIIFGGVSIATVAAAPIGSFLGDLLGWRAVFMVTAAVAAGSLAWQMLAVPAMPPLAVSRLSALVHVLRRPYMPMGMLGVILVFAGHFAFFTYLRAFLENVTGLSASGVTAVLLALGVSSFLGTLASGRMLARRLHGTLQAMPLIMAVLALGLVLAGEVQAFAAILVAAWGFAFAPVAAGWSTWLTRTVPDEAEAGGGVLVAAIQVAIMSGAATGGAVLHHGGVSGAFIASAVILVLAGLTVALGLRAQRRSPAAAGER